MRKFGVLCTLLFTAGLLCAQQGYTPQFQWVGYNPSGSAKLISTDSSGNVNVSGSGSGVNAAAQSGYIPQVVTLGQLPNGQFQPLQLDSTGALKTTGSGSGGTTITNVVFTPTDAVTIVATWTTSGPADSFAWCGGQGALDNGQYVAQTSHKVILTGLIAHSSYPCYVNSAGVDSAVTNVKTPGPVTRIPIMGASMGGVTITPYVGDTTYNFDSNGLEFMALDDAGSPCTNSDMMLTQITNDATLALSCTNGLTNYGSGGTSTGTDGPGGVALSYKESGLFGMNGRLFMFEQRNLYSSGGSVPQTVYFGNVIADNGDHGATWSNHQDTVTFNANGSPDGPGISMFTDTTNSAWCSPVIYGVDDGTNGYLTAGNEIDGANAYVYANCTDGNWNNSNHLWMKRTARVNFANLVPDSAWQWWTGPTSPAPADFVNPANWSYASTNRTAIYSAAGQVSAANEHFVPGFNYYVLETWYQPSINDPSTTVWNLLSGPTPAGSFVSFFTATFNPAGWYNEAFQHKQIAACSGTTSCVANLIFSGNYGSGSATYYHPAFAPMTLLSTPPSQTLGALPAPTANFGGQYVEILLPAFSYSGHLTSFTIQNYSSYAGSINVGACTDNGGGNYSFANYVTVSSAAGTAQQTFNAPGNFTAPAIAAGQHACFWAGGGNGLGKSDTGTPGALYSSSSYGTIPAGSFAVVGFGPPNGVDLQETISIP